MLSFSIAIVAGIAGLIWGADRMVLGAGVTARNLGISPMIIGLTVLGFVTSAPEMVVSAMASLSGLPNLAIGNAIGSNIANIGLVAGTTALASALLVRSETLRSELGAVTIISCVPVVLFVDSRLSRFDGVLLLAGLVAFLYWIARLGLRTRGHDAIEAQYAAEIPADMRLTVALSWLFVGFGVLIAASKALVWGAEGVAGTLGVSDLIIGVTIVAIGTSLPELAVSIVAVRKGEHAMALGNIIGSNAFNMLAVIGIAATIAPVLLSPEVLALHLPVMIAMAVAFFFMTYNHQSDTMRVGRINGLLLLLAFFSYHGLVASQVL